jgi:putative DNA primase/helicase
MLDALAQFRDAIRATGLEPPDVIEPGKLHRFPGVGKRQSNRAGWCLLFDDELGGCFGDWSSGFTENWQAKRKKPFGNQPYLARKAIKANGARLHKGALVLPVMDFAGKLTSLQFIEPDGRKLLLSGGRKRGCFIPVAGDMAGASRVIICEGWATGCTLAGDEPAALVLAAIDAGNLGPVAVAARRRWPSTELVIAGDDDRQTPGNPGATKARAAAIAAGALLAFPQWPMGAPERLSDFNDLHQWVKGASHG